MSRYTSSLILLVSLFWAMPARGMLHLVTGANHPELEWRTLTTEHFNIHYHQGLEDEARACAGVAEQVFGPITRQLGVEPPRRTELAITSVDEMVNGFAFQDRIAVWVGQNESMRHFPGGREWRHLVIAHEFQHTVTFAALRDWRGTLGLGLSGTPAWWMEGLAEYYTEAWSASRSDQALRRLTLDQRLADGDPHDVGYAKVLYLAWRDGDSTLARITRWRHPLWRTHDFRRAFKAVTGQRLKAFEAEWRRVMNAVYHAELALAEPTDELGLRLRLPLARVSWYSLLPDSSAWIALGRDSLSRLDLALYRIPCDSAARVERLAEGGLLGRAALSADGRRVVLDRRALDRHGSRGADLWSLDLAGGGLERLTRDGRSRDPALASDGALAWVATREGRHCLMLREPGRDDRVLWNPGPDWELTGPAFAPDGQALVVAADDAEARRALHLVARDTGVARALPPAHADERDPVWVADSLILTTANADDRPNLFARDLSGAAWRVSDGAEGLWCVGAARPGIPLLAAMAPDSAGRSRPLLVDPARRADRTPLPLQPRYTAWRRQAPEIRVPAWDRDAPAAVLDDRPYQALALRPLVAAALPLPRGGVALLALADPLMKNTLTLLGGWSAPPGSGPAAPFALASLANAGTAWNIALTSGWRTGYGLTLRDGRLRAVNASFAAATLGRTLSWDQSPYASLTTALGARLEDSWWEKDDAASTPWDPLDSRSGQLALLLTWRLLPPEREGFWWPRRAAGLQGGLSLARPWIYGGEHLDWWQARGYWMQPTPLSVLRLFTSARVDLLTGRRETWRTLGLGADPLLDPADLAVAGLVGTAGLPTGPLSHLRALGRDLAGDRAAQGTLELRLALLRPSLFQVLSVSSARVDLAPFVDAGRVGDRGRLAGGPQAAEWLWTTGVETQVGVRVGKATIAALGLGWGGEGLDWLRDGRERRGFWRLHVGRPF